MGVTRACILAAGIGNRLGDSADQRPKALLEFGGRSLLSRHLENLAAMGVRDVAIGVGYRAEEIERAARAAGFPGDISFVENPHYREGSVITMSVLGPAMTETGGPVILMDADVLYSPSILARLGGTEHPNCLLVDRDFVPGDEPVKVCIRGEKEIVDFRKIVETPYDWCGESVGFFRWSPAVAAGLAARAASYIDAGRRDAPYEEVIRDAILADPGAFGFEDVSGKPWIEIDFPDDLRRAEEEILPRL